MKLIICAASSVLIGCSSGLAQSPSTPAPDPVFECSEALANYGVTGDWTAFHATPGNENENISNIDDAMSAIGIGLTNSLKCQPGITEFTENGSCAFLGGYSASNVYCVLEDKNLGTFSVMNGSVEGAVITWMRFD